MLSIDRIVDMREKWGNIMCLGKGTFLLNIFCYIIFPYAELRVSGG